MKRAILAVCLLALAPGAARADTHIRRRGLHVIVDAAAIGTIVVTETVAKDSLASSSCRWCAPDSVDAHVRSSLVWGNRSAADSISNVTGYVASSLGLAGMLFVSSADRDMFADDVMGLVEAVVYTSLATQIIKFSVARQRPYANFTPPVTPSSEDNLSFLSGHTSFAFSLATAAGMIAHRRHYKLEPAIWATGMALAAATGYLRIAADKHYLTDVLAGAALGVAGGLWVPQISGALPADLTVVPTSNGLAVVGMF